MLRRGVKDGPSHHVIGGKFAKKKPLPRVAPAIGAAASPEQQRYTQKEASPSSMDSAIKHLSAKTTDHTSSPRTASHSGASPRTLPCPFPEEAELDLEHSLPCEATAIESATVRDGPELGSKRVGEVKKGERVLVVEEQTVEVPPPRLLPTALLRSNG